MLKPQHGCRHRIEDLTCKMPDRSFRLGPADADLLRDIVSGPRECVYHSMFGEQSSGARLFGGDMTLGGRASEFPPAARTEDQMTLFLRYNFARWQVVRLSMDPGSRGRLTMSGARLLLAWHRRALEARDALARNNHGLVLSMVKRYKPTILDYDDAVSDANMALLGSIAGFDPSRGNKFSTYACRSMLKAFARGAQRAGKRRGMFPTEFDPALERPDSADDPRREEAFSEGAEEIADILRENRAGLSTREMQVLRDRFYSEQRLTLEQVGVTLGVTKERVRQIQEGALAKIREAYMLTL